MVNYQQVENKSTIGSHIDIFISYAREDRSEAEILANALETQGWSVWFDTRISAGVNWYNAVETALESARSVVVIWSKASLQSDWVRAEAESARLREIVFPVCIADVQPPVVFRTIQTPNLIGWAGKISHPGFIELVTGISVLLGKPNSYARPVTHNNQLRPRSIRLLIGSIALPIVAMLTLNLTQVPEVSINLDATVSQFDLTLDRDSDIFDSMVLQEFSISGLQEIQIPREKNVDGHQREAYAAQTDKFTLKNSTSPQKEGSITLEPISARAGTRLQFLHQPNSNDLGVELNGLRDSIRVNIMGNVTVQYPPSTNYMSDFGSPKPLLFLGDGRDINIVITPVTVPSQWLSTSLPIRHLAFSRIDEKTTLTTTSVLQVSTIISGLIKFESLEGRIVNLTPRELIRFSKLKGEITALSIVNEGIRLQFIGVTSALDRCINTDCQNEIPSRWEWLLGRYPLLIYSASAFYALSVIAFLIKFWRRVPN